VIDSHAIVERLGGVMRSLCIVLMMLVAGRASAEETTVGILAVDAHGLSASEVETLADAIAAAAHELLPGRVLGPAEVRELLKEAGAKPAKKCKSKRCWLKVGKAAELSAVLAIRAVGNKRGVALSFKWVDVAKKRITARHQQPIRNDVMTFAEDTTAAVTKLREKLAGKIPEPVAPPEAVVAAVEPVPPPVEEAAEPAPPAPEPEPAGDSAVAASTAVAMATSAPQPPTSSSTTTARPAEIWLGLGLGRGAVVRRVADDGPGAAAGLQPGDVIREWDGWVISTAKDIMGFALRTGLGRSARIKVVRGGSEKTLSLAPAALGDGAEEDAYEVADVGGPPASTMPARSADSAPRGWPPPGAPGSKKGINKKRR